jgi:WD40 repeat protein
MIVLQGHPAPITSVAFSPAGDAVLAGFASGAIELWVGTERALDFPYGLMTQGPIYSVAYHPERGVAVGGSMGWRSNLEPGSPEQARIQSDPRARSVASLKFVDGKLLAVGYGDRAKKAGGGLELWEPATLKRRPRTFPVPAGIRTVDVSPVGPKIAWGDWDQRLTVWPILQPDPWMMTLSAVPQQIAWHPSGESIAVAVNWTVEVIVVGRKPIDRVFRGPKGLVSSVAFTPDGRTCWAGSWDGTVRAWDVASSLEQACFQWPVGKVTALAISPDGTQLAAGGHQGALVLFDLE